MSEQKIIEEPSLYQTMNRLYKDKNPICRIVYMAKIVQPVFEEPKKGKRDKIIEQSKSNLISTEKKYNDLLQAQKNENNSINQRCLNMQNEINEFNNKLLKKERDINNLENSLLKNRDKDNQIFILKKQIKEQEDIINDIQNKLNLADKELQSLKTFNEERMKAFYSINHTDKNN